MASLKTAILTAIACLCLSSRGFAFTGAELVQSNDDFGRGYVFGVVEGYVRVLQQDAKAEQRRQNIDECLGHSSVSAETLYRAVANHVQSHPKELAEPAVGAIFRTMDEICPK